MCLGGSQEAELLYSLLYSLCWILVNKGVVSCNQISPTLLLLFIGPTNTFIIADASTKRAHGVAASRYIL